MALEIARALNTAGQRVISTDSFRYPLTAGSSAIDRHYTHRPPAENPEGFCEDLINIIRKEEVDLLIPTCEEVFYVSRFLERLQRECSVLCSPMDILKSFHSKIEILHLAENAGFAIPETRVLEEGEYPEGLDGSGKVLKREFCRFGTDVLMEPGKKDIDRFLKKKMGRVLIQEKIKGREICIYGIARQGKLLASAQYHPLYKLKDTASLYFQKVYYEELEEKLRELCRIHGFHGQISLDVMLSEESFYILECNPRATSGVHLFERQALGRVLIHGQEIAPGENGNAMVSLLMLLMVFPRSFLQGKARTFFCDYRGARNIFEEKNGSCLILRQFASLLELWGKSLRYGLSLQAASTRDIEWNGNPSDF